MNLTKLVFHFYHFPTIFYGFSKFQAIWSLKYYSYESMTLQKTPWTYSNCCTRSLVAITVSSCSLSSLGMALPASILEAKGMGRERGESGGSFSVTPSTGEGVE